MSAKEASQVVSLAEWKRSTDVDLELMVFIDHAIIPILVQRWIEQCRESGSENAPATAEQLPAAA